MLDQGIDPSQDKKERQRERDEANANTFEKLARKWHSNKLPTWSAATVPDALSEARRRVAKLDRGSLIGRFRAAFAEGKRLVAFVMAQVLVERGIPPSFWHEELALDSTTGNLRADLLLFDLACLGAGTENMPVSLDTCAARRC